MSSEPDEGPVYYREIQKNAYLKRIPNETSTSKLRALGQKKPPLKAMWTLFCVHNGDTPFLEQYDGAESAATLAHRPAWRACLRTARHVTASVQPRLGEQYDFLIDTDCGPVRMLAPDWDSMQEWVTTLRNKLHELRILTRGQNVYCSPPAAPPPRAAARDPTSPLPPTPPVPPHTVPGIELHTPISRPIAPPESQSTNENSLNTATSTDNSQIPSSSNQSQNTTNQNQNSAQNSISSSLTSINSTPSTSNSTKPAPDANTSNFQNSVATTQNSITMSQNSVNTAQNPITFAQNSINSGPSSINLPVVENVDISSWDPSSLPSTSQEKLDPKKSVAKICGQNICLDDSILKRTVTESDEEFFAEIDRIHDSIENLSIGNDFGNYKQRLVVGNGERGGLSRADSVGSKPQRTNITVIQVSNKPPHTAIPVMGPETDVFDFNFKQQLKVTEPQDYINIVNTETHLNSNNYGTVFNSDSDYGHLSLATTVNVKDVMSDANVRVTDGNVRVTDGNVRVTDGVYERLCLASTSNNETASPLSVRRIKMAEKVRKSSLPNLELTDDSTYEYLFPNSNNNTTVTVNSSRESSRTNEINSNVSENRVVSRSNSQHRALPRVPVTVNSVESISNISVDSRSNIDCNARSVRSNVERSQSQNAYDGAPRRERRMQNSPKRDKNDRTEATQPKPIWKRGLTELSLLSKLRGIGQTKRQESPTRHDSENNDRSATSPVKVVRRSRPEVRVDSARRRSNSLSNGQSPPYPGPLQPLRARQAAALRAEQRRAACVPAAVSAVEPPLFCEYERMLWVARWGRSGLRCGGRAGDRVAALGGSQLNTVQQARLILKSARTPLVDILFHRVPLGKIYVINRRENDSLGIKLDSECTITSVEGNSAAARAGIPPPGKWCITEVNNRPINLVKGGEEEINRLSMHGTEVSILIQPAALVKKIRAAIKSSKPLLGLR